MNSVGVRIGGGGARVDEVEAIVSATTLVRGATSAGITTIARRGKEERVGRPGTTARALRTENLVNFRRDFEGPSPPMHDGAAFSFCEDRRRRKRRTNDVGE